MNDIMNDIEKSALIVTNTIKEIIILFLALIITLNYCINFIKNDLDKCEPDDNNNVEKNGILYYIQHIIHSTINEMMKSMKCYILNKKPGESSTTNTDNSNNYNKPMYVSIYYGIFIVVLYLFFNMKNVNNNSWNDISNDFTYKLTTKNESF